ncbi:hypothetical protein F5Y19DRAFT_490538 [Xylariaceae sp. FL1651]|nr:hypothetical protein F5Y19DRAFT_490538 [Xylariaceae sp. FL1651]
MHAAEAYSILGAEYGASLPLVKEAYRRKSLYNHPDKAGSSKEAHEHMIKINLAYEILEEKLNKETTHKGQANKRELNKEEAQRNEFTKKNHDQARARERATGCKENATENGRGQRCREHLTNSRKHSSMPFSQTTENKEPRRYSGGWTFEWSWDWSSQPKLNKRESSPTQATCDENENQKRPGAKKTEILRETEEDDGSYFSERWSGGFTWEWNPSPSQQLAYEKVCHPRKTPGGYTRPNASVSQKTSRDGSASMSHTEGRSWGFSWEWPRRPS